MNKKTNTTHIEQAVVQSNEDFKNALIIVSITINVFILVTWIATQVSEEYAAQLASLI